MSFGFKNTVKNIKSKLFSEKRLLKHSPNQMLLMNNFEAKWSERNYSKFASEAYIKNVIANRAINLIADSAASVNWKLYTITAKEKTELKQHEILDILHKPNSTCNGADFFRQLISYKIISGNSYVVCLKPFEDQRAEIFLLRPDRVRVLVNKQGNIVGYNYKSESSNINYTCNPLTNEAEILHWKNFHPLDDYYGLSQIEAAAFSIDLHNNSNIWNQSLLQNGARPSGALVVKGDPAYGLDALTENQYERLKEEVASTFSGSRNNGRPLLLQGGLEWQEMSISPKELDFIEAKNSAARDIALSFGVPPQLLGIKGDNTYHNFQEARLAFWEETILPLLDNLCDALNQWLIPKFDSEKLYLSIDKDNISALAPRRESLWQKIESASFLNNDEKRQLLGFKILGKENEDN